MNSRSSFLKGEIYFLIFVCSCFWLQDSAQGVNTLGEIEKQKARGIKNNVSCMTIIKRHFFPLLRWWTHHLCVCVLFFVCFFFFCPVEFTSCILRKCYQLSIQTALLSHKRWLIRLDSFSSPKCWTLLPPCFFLLDCKICTAKDMLISGSVSCLDLNLEYCRNTHGHVKPVYSRLFLWGVHISSSFTDPLRPKDRFKKITCKS